MKKMLSILLCAAMLVCFSGCSQGVPKNMTSAANENDAFNFYVPKSWGINTSGGTASAFYSANDRSNVSMTGMLEDEGLTTLEEYCVHAFESFREILPQFDGLYALPGEADNKGVTLGGEPAAFLTYTAVLDGVNYKYMQLVCKHSGLFYIFTYTSTVEAYDSHQADLDLMLQYISFK